MHDSLRDSRGDVDDRMVAAELKASSLESELDKTRKEIAALKLQLSGNSLESAGL